MISGENISQYISNPQGVKQEDLSSLADLVKKYPYSSSLHLLELKGLALANSIEFEEKLKSTAIHAPDRSHLYALIHSGTQTKTAESLIKEEEKVEENVVAVEETPEVIVAKEEIKAIDTTEPQITSETAKIEHKAQEEPETHSKAVALNEEVHTDAIEYIETEEEAEQHKEQAVELKTTSELDIEILNKAIDVAYVSSEVGTKEIIQETTNNDEKEFVKEISEKVEATEQVEIEVPIETEASSDIDRSNLTFIQWLRLKQEGKTETNEPLTDTTSITPPATSHIETEEETEKFEEKSKGRKEEIDALLDKFMQEEPRISKPVKDFYNPAKNAQKSVEEPDDMVSETLAKIHVLQKNYSKAISAYEKLILLYPEKKTFFASRIEKIREESKKR